MFKIPIANPSIDKKEALSAYRVIRNGWISMGSEVSKLEKKIEKYIGVKYAILFNNGTSALHAALSYYGIKKGDEVIVPTLSYISSANVILYCGAKPVFCEIDPVTFNVTAESIIKKILKKTKAIINVDLKGLPIDYDDIKKKLKKYKIPLISDSAEAFGAIYKKKSWKPELNFLVNTGLYIMEPKVLKLIPANRDFNMIDLINKAKKKKMKIGSFPVSENSWIDVGQWGEYFKNNKL